MTYRKIRVALFAVFNIAIIMVAFSGGALAEAGSTPLKWDPALTVEKLDNGMTVVYRQNKKPEKRVEIRLAVKAGSIYEEDGKEGLAHFLEHMAFNGTTNFKPGELVKYLESVGAEFGPDTNAYTSWEHTVYMLTLPCEDEEVVRKGLVIMSDYMNGITFETEEIEKERGVILEELRIGKGLGKRLFEKMAHLAAPGSIWDTPRLSVVGEEKSVAAITREDFLSFYKKYYRPDRMMLVVVGDMTVDAMRKLALETVAKVPAAEGATEYPAFPMPGHDEIYSGLITDKELPVGGAGFGMVRDYRPALTEADYRKDMVEDLINEILSYRLEEKKETEKPPFTEAYTGYYFDGPWFKLQYGSAVTAEMKTEKRAFQAMLTEVERVRRHGVLEAETRERLKAWKERIATAIKEKEKMESDNLAYAPINAFVNGGTPVSYEDKLRLIEELDKTLSMEEFSAAAKEMFEPKSLVLAVMVPEYQKKMYAKTDFREWFREVVDSDVLAYQRVEAKKNTDYSALVPGKIIERNELKEVGATRVKFENGLTVYLKKTDFQEDEILISATNPSQAGWDESLRNYGISSLMGSLWDDGGVAGLKDSQISRLLAGKQFSLSFGHSISGTSINRDFEEALQWARDYMTTPDFGKEALEVIKNNMKTQLRDEKLDQSYAFDRAYGEVMCPGRRGSIYIDDENYYDRFTAEQIKDWWKKTFRPGGMQFTLVGNIDIEKSIELMGKYFGNLPAAEPGFAERPYLARTCPFPKGYTRRVVYRGIEDRTMVEMLIPGPRWNADEYPAASMMARILDTKLMDKIREELGGTYTSSVYLMTSPYMDDGDRIGFYFPTDPARVEEMIKEVEKLMADFAQNGPSEQELKSAREIISKNMEEKLKKNGFWQGVLYDAEYGPAPVTLPFEMHEKKMKATAEEIKAAAKKWLTPDADRIEVIAFKERAKDAAKREEEDEKK